MNGDGEDVVAHERRIWCYHFGDRYGNRYADPYLRIDLVNAQDRHSTISELRNFIERHVENGTDDTIASELSIYSYYDGPRPTEQECTLLGRSFQPLVHHLQKLAFHGNGWTDLERSCILRHMSLPSSTIDFFLMNGIDVEMPMIIRTLSDESPASLCDIQLYKVVLTSEDCQLLGQMISNKERALNCLKLWFCSFSCLADFLTLIAGFVKDKISSQSCSFYGCTVKDASIPNQDGADYLEFVRIFGVFWKRRHGDATFRLGDAALDLLNYFRPMQQAGLLRLLPPSENTDRDASVTEARQPRGARGRDRSGGPVVPHSVIEP